VQYGIEGIVAQPEVWGSAQQDGLIVQYVDDLTGLFGRVGVLVTALITEQFGTFQYIPYEGLGVQQFYGHHLGEPIGDGIEFVLHEFLEQPLQFGHDQMGTVDTVLNGKGNLCLGHVQAIGAYLAVEPEMSRGALAPVVGVGKAQHRQYGVTAIAHRELGAVGEDKVHTEGPVVAIDGLAVVIQPGIDEHLFRLSEKMFVWDVPIALGGDVHDFTIADNGAFQPFTGGHLGQFVKRSDLGRYEDLILL